MLTEGSIPSFKKKRKSIVLSHFFLNQHEFKNCSSSICAADTNEYYNNYCDV